MSARPTQRSAFLLGPERLEVRSVPVPDPGPGEILLRIEAATTCGTDVKVFRRGGHPRMLKVPTAFGHEMAGTVAAVGEGVTRFRDGDRVAVANSAPCGRCAACRQGRENLCADLHYLNGAFAEYLLVPRRFVEKSTYPCPPGLRAEIAALAEPLACVLHGLEILGLEVDSRAEDSGQEIALFGGGPIGLLFVDLLSRAGRRVTVADPNPVRLSVALRLGAVATVVVGRDGGEAERIRARSAHGEGFDLAIEATGSPAAWEDAMDAVRPGGVILLFGGYPPATTVPLNAHRLHYSELTVKGAYHHRPATYRRALELLGGDTLRPELLLSAERPLEEVEAALRSMMRRETLKVVIRP